MSKVKAKELPRKSTMDMSWDELFDKKKEYHDNFNMMIYGEPTRTFEVGEHIILGNLDDVTIAYDYGDGIYAVNIPQPPKADKNLLYASERRVVKWININKIPSPSNTKFANDMYRVPKSTQSDMNSLIHMNTHNGYIMDDRFQRGYVWNDIDRESLLDTIFNQGNIGSFLFNRHNGYNFRDSDEVNQFHTITGESILIPKKDNHCISVIDGQQRITTLLNFYFDRFKYKGYYFSELSFKDRYTFGQFSISYALVDESDGWNLKDWVWLFLQANKGVSLNREHLENMENYFRSL